MSIPIAIILPYIPQLVTFAIKLGGSILEMTRDMTPEEMEKLLAKTYEDIAVEKRLKRNMDGKLEWS